MDFSDWIQTKTTYSVFGKELEYIPPDSPEHNGKDWQILKEIESYVRDKYGINDNSPLNKKTSDKIAKDTNLLEMQNRLINLCFPQTKDLDLTSESLTKKRLALLAKIQNDFSSIAVSYEEIYKLVKLSSPVRHSN